MLASMSAFLRFIWGYTLGRGHVGVAGVTGTMQTTVIICSKWWYTQGR